MDVMESGQLGKYRLRRLLERGTVGGVYESWDPDLARRVTIKVLPFEEIGGDREESYAQFLGEAQAAERLHHPNIVSVFGSGKTRHSAYVVQDSVEGVPLSHALTPAEPLALGEIAQIMESMLNGLHYSHSRGVVHGDLTPDRVLLTNNDQVKITGFGLAHASRDWRVERQQAVGNFAYLAPEQVLGEAASIQSDIYAAGALLYAMLTGRPPFECSDVGIIHLVVNAALAQPSRVSPIAPPSLDGIVAKAMAKQAAERYASALEFGAELRREFALLDLTGAPPARPVAPQHERSTEGGPSEGVDVGADIPPPVKVVGAKPVPELGLVPDASRVGRAWLQQPMLIAACVLLLGGVVVVLVGPSPSFRPVPPSTPTLVGLEGTSDAMLAPAPATSAVAAALKTEAARAGPGDDIVAGREEQLPALLRSAVAAIPCSLISAHTTSDGNVAFSGVTALGEASAIEAEAHTRRVLGELVSGKGVVWEVGRSDGPYCAQLGTLTAAGAAEDGVTELSVVPASAGWDATSAGPLDLLVTMPNYPALLQVDVFEADDTVLHRVMAVAGGTGLYRAGERVRMVAVVDDAAAKGGLVTVIAASEPLFAERRAERELAADYLETLRASLAQARNRGVRVAVAALPIEGGGGRSQ